MQRYCPPSVALRNRPRAVALPGPPCCILASRHQEPRQLPPEASPWTKPTAASPGISIPSQTDILRLMTARSCACWLSSSLPKKPARAPPLRRTREIPARIAERIGADPEPLAAQLKGMARRGLIAISRTPDGLAYGALPFVVGIYENLVGELDVEFARLFEGY